MICKADIERLKQELTESIGQKIVVEGSLKRGKTFDVGVQSDAVITKTYQNCFNIEAEGRSYSYQYKDVLDKTIDIKLFDGQKFNCVNVQENLCNPTMKF